MRLLTPHQALELDAQTFQRRGYSSAQFIEAAGQGVVSSLEKLGWLSKPTLVLVGPGFNGSDGRWVAQDLEKRGTRVRIWQMPLEAGLSDESIEFAEVVVDAIFGVGLNRPIEGSARTVIEKINQARHQRRQGSRPLQVVSVDVPSGLNSLTGFPMGVSIRADHTFTIQAAKPGFFQNQGPSLTGRVTRLTLPYPSDLFRECAQTHFACGIRTAAALIPRRKLDSNKGDHGRVTVIAGSSRYPGAGVLCARGALRTGVGSVRRIQFDQDLNEIGWVPEALFEQWLQIPQNFNPYETFVVGPGVTDLEKIRQVLVNLRASGCEKVVVDASALPVLQAIGGPFPSDWILTPHPKELGQMIGLSTLEVQQNRFEAAEKAHQIFAATILLKGYKTVVHQGGKNFICLRGHSALAKAGMGDVLAGIIGSLRAQGLAATSAAVTGALIHGLTADLWLQKGDTASLNPSDVLELIPIAQKKIKSIDLNFQLKGH